MSSVGSPLSVRALCLCAAALVLSSCAPAPGVAPSAALSEQLQLIRRQQQDQAEQLSVLKHQMDILQQALGIDPGSRPPADRGTLPPGESTAFQPPSTPASPVSPATGVDLDPATILYLGGFAGLASGQPADAEYRFEQFLREFPHHPYSINARFRLAEAQTAQGKNDIAASNLRRIIVDPAAQSKAPAAMIQLADIYRRQGYQHQAEDILEQLRVSYPDSSEAQQLIRSDKVPPTGAAPPR